jgi:hypothetical protein
MGTISTVGESASFSSTGTGTAGITRGGSFVTSESLVSWGLLSAGSGSSHSECISPTCFDRQLFSEVETPQKDALNRERLSAMSMPWEILHHHDSYSESKPTTGLVEAGEIIRGIKIQVGKLPNCQSKTESRHALSFIRSAAYDLSQRAYNRQGVDPNGSGNARLK